MASHGSFIRSAARATFSACSSAARATLSACGTATRATFSAYRRVPVRWRLGGGSAGLTFIILAVFAVGVGVLTDRQVNRELNYDLSANVDNLHAYMHPVLVPGKHAELNCTNSYDLSDFAKPDSAQIRVMDESGTVLCTQANGYSKPYGVTAKELKTMPDFGIPLSTAGPYEEMGYRIEARRISWKKPLPKHAGSDTHSSAASGGTTSGQGSDDGGTTTTGATSTGTLPKSSVGPTFPPASSGTPSTKAPTTETVNGYVLYARKISAADQTTDKVRVWLTLGVIGGAILALLAGLLVADRAMRPISELTDVAREIERTRNPTLSIPQPQAEDEVAELAHTLAGMLGALDDARNEAVSALARQREFVADASHELRTPLTSVLANLELLADELEGEPADSAKSALMATRRMRRLVGDLLLLARADVERNRTLTTVDLAETLTNVAVELGPVAEEHVLEISPEPAPLMGLHDDIHRLVLNLIENAIHHTPAGTRIHAVSRMEGSTPVLTVEDDGPGISAELQSRVFERFVRGGGDSGSSRGTGLGLSIVSAVAAAHGATVTLTSLPQLSGTRFEVRFPPQPVRSGEAAPDAQPTGTDQAAQTSTTTGRTIGRRRSRS